MEHSTFWNMRGNIALEEKRLVEVDSMTAAIIDATSKIDGLEIFNFGSGRALEVREAFRILASILPFKAN